MEPGEGQARERAVGGFEVRGGTQDRVGASDACTVCLADFYDCLVANCLAECVIGGDACTQCSRNKVGPSGMTCSGQWFDCSGTSLNPNF